jgi:hypothetical protein
MDTSDSLNFEYEFFKKETIIEQYERIKKEITPNLTYSEIISRFSEFRSNGTVITKTYDKSSEEIILYRVTQKYDGFDKNLKDKYSHPPSKKTKQARANLAEHPVLYTSIDLLTAISEMKNKLKIGEKFYISKWRIHFKKNVITHLLLVNSTTASSENPIKKISSNQIKLLKSSIQNIPEEYQEGYIESIKQLGDLFATPSDKYYHFTSAYSHYVLYGVREQNAFVDMLFYPSVENDQKSINVAIHPDFVKSNQMSLEEVYEVAIKENTLKYKKNGVIGLNIYRKGIFSKTGNVKWLIPKWSLSDINFNELQIRTYNKTVYKGNEACLKKVNSKGSTIKDWLKETLNNKDFSNSAPNFTLKLEKQDLLEDDIITENFNLIFETRHGTKIETSGGLSCVKYVSIPIELKNHYVMMKDEKH